MKKFVTTLIPIIIFILLSSNLYNLIVEKNNLKTALNNECIINKELNVISTNLKLSIIELEIKITDLNKTMEILLSNTKKDELISTNPINASKKEAYLTFDDGPSENTSKILKILKDNDISATFFVNGHPGYEAVYKNIINQGSIIGNHTYSHDYKTIYSSITAYNEDVEKLNSFLEGIGIPKPTLMRFPGGSNNTISNSYGSNDLMNKLTKEQITNGYQYIDWNITSGDSNKITESKDVILKNVLNVVKGMDSIVILFHDSTPKTTTVEALPIIIKRLKELGYVFKTLSVNSPVIHFK